MAKPRMYSRLGVRNVLALFVAAACIGCGGRGVELVRVQGKVTLSGQGVPGPGTLYFTPAAPADGMPGRPGKARFDGSGEYSARCFDDTDGLIPGRYKIAVHCWETPPTMQGPPAKSYIASRYGSAATSELEVEVVSGARKQVLDIELQE